MTCLGERGVFHSTSIAVNASLLIEFKLISQYLANQRASNYNSTAALVDEIIHLESQYFWQFVNDKETYTLGCDLMTDSLQLQ